MVIYLEWVRLFGDIWGIEDEARWGNPMFVAQTFDSELETWLEAVDAGWVEEFDAAHA